MRAAHLGQAGGGRVAHERVVAVIVAAERHHAGDAEAREHLPIDVVVDRRRQPEARRLEAQALVVEDEQRPGKAEPRVEHRGVRHRAVVVGDEVVGAILFVDAPLGDGDVGGEEDGRRAERLAIRIAHEHLLLVRQLVIDPAVDVVDVQLGVAGREIVLRAGHGIPGLVRQREVIEHVARDGIDQVRRDPVALELVTNESAGRVRPRRERIEDANQLAVLREGLGEVPLALRQRRHGGRRLRLPLFAQALERRHEEGAAPLDRPARDAAELAALVIAERRSRTLREIVVRIERRVAEELVGAAVELVGAGLVDDVQDAAEAAAVLGGIVRAEHLELLDRVDRGEHRDAREPVDGGEGGRHPVDHRIHHRRPRAVDAVAHRVVVVADRAGHARRQEDQRIDVAGVQRQLEDAAVVDELADRAAARLEQRGVGPDFDFVGEIADFEGEVDDHRRVDLDGDGACRAAEALQARVDAILAGGQGQRRVAALDVRHDRVLLAGLLIGDGDVGARDTCAAHVFERPGDGAGERLCEEDRRADDEHDTECSPNQAHGCPSQEWEL